MKIQVVSYKYSLHRETVKKLTEEIIKDSPADVILFPGYTLKSEEDLNTLTIQNKHVTVCIDVQIPNLPSEQYLMRKGRIAQGTTNQVFVTSTEATIDSVGTLFNKLQKTPRRFKVQEQQFLWLMCGESNMLYRPLGGKIGFRYPEDKDLMTQFNDIMSQTDIVLNPMHSPWRRHVDLNERIKFLSRGRYYFGTSNSAKKISLNAHLIYAYYNGKELKGQCVSPENETRYKSMLFEI